MSNRDDLFGLYSPRLTPLHRLPAGAKLAGVVAISIAAMVVQRWQLSLGFFILCVALVLAARAGVRRSLWPGWPFTLMALALALYQLVLGTWQQATIITATLLGCLYVARMLSFTTRGPDLVDALVASARPLRWLGLSRLGLTPERFGLAVGLMLRSVPFIMGTFADVRDAARARGLERRLFATVSPVVVRTVGYAVATGDALAARGLGDDDLD